MNFLSEVVNTARPAWLDAIAIIVSALGAAFTALLAFYSKGIKNTAEQAKEAADQTQITALETAQSAKENAASTKEIYHEVNSKTSKLMNKIEEQDRKLQARDKTILEMATSLATVNEYLRELRDNGNKSLPTVPTIVPAPIEPKDAQRLADDGGQPT